MRVYNMEINEDDETGMDINSFVDAPAHMRSFETYSKNKTFFGVDEKRRIVTGVFIMADFLIYRRDDQLGEHFVMFSPDVIWRIRNKFFKNGFNTNTNVQHSFMVDGATLVDSYIVHDSDPRFPKVPEILAKQRVSNGSWVGSYYIENEKLWQDCKNGIFKGFSVEGYFDKIEAKIKTKTSMKKNEKKTSIFKNIFGAQSVEENMSEVTAVDGTVLFYEGDLAVGTAVTVEVNGEKVPAPEGGQQIDMEGVTYTITLDADGIVTDMQEVTAMSEEAEVLMSAMKKVVDDAKVQFSVMRKEIDALKAEIEVYKNSGKFKAQPKASGNGSDKGKGFKSLL